MRELKQLTTLATEMGATLKIECQNGRWRCSLEQFNVHVWNKESFEDAVREAAKTAVGGIEGRKRSATNDLVWYANLADKLNEVAES